MSLNNTMALNLLVFPKRSKVNSDGKSPLFLRISLFGLRAEITLSRVVDPQKWDNKRQVMLGRNPEALSINEHIRVCKEAIYKHYSKLIEKGEIITAKKLKDKFYGVDRGKKTLIQAFAYHNKRVEMQVGKNYAKGTLERYQTCLKLLIKFIQKELKVDDYPLVDINLEFITEFDFFLRTERNCNNNTTVKYIKNFKKIIRLARALEWINHDPFLNYKAKLEQVDREVLTQVEINQLLDKQFTIKRLDYIKDIFLFCCFTGLAYSDVKKLSSDNIYIGIDGNNWILLNRTKTNVQSRIPILPVAQGILDKYINHPECVTKKKLLPVPSNQKLNSYLKEIADCCGIKKNLTCHIARHTFATTITLNNNVSIESVSRMLGHRSIKTTEHYSKVSDSKINDDMAGLRSKYTFHNKLRVINQ